MGAENRRGQPCGVERLGKGGDRGERVAVGGAEGGDGEQWGGEDGDDEEWPEAMERQWTQRIATQTAGDATSSRAARRRQVGAAAEVMHSTADNGEKESGN